MSKGSWALFIYFIGMSALIAGGLQLMQPHWLLAVAAAFGCAMAARGAFHIGKAAGIEETLAMWKKRASRGRGDSE